MGIRKNELRIGNWVLHEPKNARVETEVDAHDLENLQFYHDKYGHEYEPIPLTESWMVKFGFDTYDSEIDYIEWGKLISCDFQIQAINTWYDAEDSDDNGDVFRIISDGFYERDKLYFAYDLGSLNVRRRIKYVHQLQNLYFALTGEELTVKK